MPIFVFGSNLAGRHGKGTALVAALYHRAQRGVGEGLTGNSYALPTKDATLASLPLAEIEGHVKQFLDFARSHPEKRFMVTRVGCGLAGYKPEEIAPMFAGAPENCFLPIEFASILKEG